MYKYERWVNDAQLESNSGLLSRIQLELNSQKINDYSISSDISKHSMVLITIHGTTVENVKESAEKIFGISVDDLSHIVQS